MAAYIIRRLFISIPVLIGATFLVFMVMHLSPGDPAQLMAGDGASPQDVELLRQKLGLDKPLLVQYATYMENVVSLDFGRSIRSNREVLPELMTYFGNTMELAVLGTLIAAVVGVTLGVLAAIRQNSWLDNLVMSFSLVGLSLPIFLLGVLFVLVFSSLWPVFPATGRGGPIWTLEGFQHAFLPALTLGLSAAGVIARLSRSAMLEVLHEEYIRTAMAKGLRVAKVIVKHALRNASVPITTIIGLEFGYLLGGAVVTESIFAWPGVGRLTVDAIMAKDFPVVQGAVLLIVLVFVLVNLVVDLLYAILDPRISYD
ncbi:ABC transporter permease [Brevibacillus sp. B_LB10_24]|uniref:ABC transporter permease n=1 Tax=Brevibacillus sp. B_LB10_24 TaxID=3380645 RepID=UPI0038BA5C2E